MSLSTKILKLKDHSINIDMLWIKNSESPKGVNNPGEDVIAKVSEVVGDLAPMIDINGFIFNQNDIQYMEINESGFIPSIRVLLSDESGAFTNKFYPKNKCLLKLYIKSQNKNIKAIRNDYLICDIKPSGSDRQLAAEGRGHSYYISGTLNIPILSNSAVDYFDNTSYNALFDIAKILHLGFSTNEIQTNDKMVWLQPSVSYDDFISFITQHAYKDSPSFFQTFVDRYYNLTFINLYNMLSTEEDFDAMFVNMTKNKDSYLKGSENESGDINEVQPNQLSNFSGNRGTNMYIKSYYNDSKQGRILKDNPNKKLVNYYDIQISENIQEKFLSFIVEPFGSIISDEEINNNIINTWDGIDTGNVHDNYFYARNSNTQNLLDLKKSKMTVILDGANLNLIRGMRVPVIIVKEGEQVKFNEDINVDIDDSYKKQDPSLIRLDETTTGYYIIDTLKYIYDPSDGTGSAFTTEAQLCKANWGLNIIENNTQNNA